MNAIRKYSVFAVSLTLALGIGHVMQTAAPPEHPALVLRALEADDPDARLAAARTARESDLIPSIERREVTSVSADVGAPEGANGGLRDRPGNAPALTALPRVDLPGDFLAGDETPNPHSGLSIATLDTTRADQSAPATQARGAGAADDGCARGIALEVQAPALVNLLVDAPCDADARVVVRHAGLAVTERLSPAGLLDVTLPAFSDVAEFDVAFADGTALRANAMVPDMAAYDRVAVQWQSPDTFQLHAFEFGAEFGAPGHVSAASPRDPGHALRGTGGFLMLIGDSQVPWPLLAEVYTFPTADTARSGSVAIEIEAMVTPEVCGREMLGETLEIHSGAPVQVRELTLAMPGCDAVGQFIVLKNALEALTIAAN